MKIYLIEQHHDLGWDCYHAHVIVANNENEVRESATESAAAEGRDAWETAKITIEGVYIGSKTEPFKLLSDFNAG